MAEAQSNVPTNASPNGGAEIAAVWDQLPAHIRSTITTLVQSSGVVTGRRVAAKIADVVPEWLESLAGRGLSSSSIAVYRRGIRQIIEHQHWVTVDDASEQSFLSYLASRKRNDHCGRPWGVATCFQATIVVRGFGDYLRRSGHLPADPFTDLEVPQRKHTVHKHPLSTDEARRFLLASVLRHNRDTRAFGAAPLCWWLLFYTGLRHGEIMAANPKRNPYGGVKWRDLVLDTEYPGIWTDPKWLGNKSKTRDWLPLHPQLRDALVNYRPYVPSSPNDPVFPHHPVRKTFDMDRRGAGLPKADSDGRIYSVHSTRATYATWLGEAPGIPEGLRQRLVRHHENLTEQAYTTRTKADLATAISSLPLIWPEGIVMRVEKLVRPKPVTEPAPETPAGP